MAVGGVKGGGGPKGPKGPSGAKSTSSTFKVTGPDEAGKAESLVGASRASGTSEAGAVGGADPITSGLQQIAKELKDGTIGSKSEATQKAVHLILEKRQLLGKNSKSNKKLVEQIADTLTDDPRLAAALERTWSRAGNK